MLTSFLSTARPLRGHAHDRTQRYAGPPRRRLAGLRYNEIKTLTWADIDFDKAPARITIRAKNAKSKREDTIPISDALAAALLTWRESEKARLHRAPEPQERLVHLGSRFHGPHGSFKKDCDAARVKWLRTLLRAAGLPEGRLNELSPVHCLRHTCGVMLYRATKNLRLVQKQLRHTRSTTTEVYANLLDEDWRAGVEAAFTEPSDVGLRLSGS